MMVRISRRPIQGKVKERVCSGGTWKCRLTSRFENVKSCPATGKLWQLSTGGDDEDADAGAREGRADLEPRLMLQKA